MTITEFVIWKVTSMQLLYDGFTKGDIKSARSGATMMYMLVSTGMWKPGGLDYTAMLMMALRANGVDGYTWDKTTEFLDYIKSQLARVTAINNTLKTVQDFMDEPGGDSILSALIGALSKHPNIIDECESEEDILNNLRKIYENTDYSEKDKKAPNDEDTEQSEDPE